ncbi:MAG: hypothetical protein M3R41_06535, partial [Pseudomonadota bacterium]|nr:hypothetical protein [Pseudomonadota bacterium]
MTHRSLRPLPLFVLALVAGISFWPASHWWPHDGAMAIWKGSGVGLLAAWTIARMRGPSGRLLALVMVLGTIGDIVLEFSQAIGGAAFLAGHIVAIWLYRRERGGEGGAIG